MKSEVIVREVTIEEAAKVNEQIIEFEGKYSVEHFEKRYESKEHLIIVGYLNNTRVGYIVGYDRDEDGSFYCWMAGVDPKFRKRGVLTALMEYQMNWAKGKGYSKLKIKTRNNRREMLAYLVKNEFYFTGVEQYPETCDNRISLEKVI